MWTYTHISVAPNLNGPVGGGESGYASSGLQHMCICSLTCASSRPAHTHMHLQLNLCKWQAGVHAQAHTAQLAQVELRICVQARHPPLMQVELCVHASPPLVQASSKQPTT